ncbi:MAG: radical SAM protein [Spirochaetales bacterium]|uniref:Radical SAM protein n=1 Tax=Candidatus Thalassospirochaeta sargassi TaxID=3119039 RepID=A0AAJ1ICT8_9SPIO|nr:radical SAM protein [Spirochaetales bacterium]
MLLDPECTEEKGRIKINISVPADVASRYGFRENEQYNIREYTDGIFLRQSPDVLKRIYIEATNKCNLNCKTCIRNVWGEDMGLMDFSLFEKIVADAERLSEIHNENYDNTLMDYLNPERIKQRFTFFFGGWGEPLMHPDIIRMIKKVKKRGWRAELITSGTLLSEEMSRNLIDAGLDFIWVSLDGATPESYKNVRLGNMLPGILENLKGLRKLKAFNLAPGPQIGIAFVAMQNNINELPGLIDICRRIDAKNLSVSNVLPFTEDLLPERLYKLSSGNWGKGDLRIDFPRMDATPEIADLVQKAASAGGWYSIAGNELDHRIGVCPFIKKASLSIRWDGKISPCTPLFYDSESYLENTLRKSKACHFGDVNHDSLAAVWLKDEYRALRRKLQFEEFSPCTVCNSCEMAESNEEDCFGDTHPACGGCLWQQGFIQCP